MRVKSKMFDPKRVSLSSLPNAAVFRFATGSGIFMKGSQPGGAGSGYSVVSLEGGYIFLNQADTQVLPVEGTFVEE